MVALGKPIGTLSGVLPGQRCIVQRVMCQGPVRRRFYDLGIVPGTRIDVLRRSPVGDPTAFRVRGAMLALRSTETDQIIVEPVAG